MPSEEGKQVLQLLAEGKINVEQAYRLLRALGDVEEGAPRPPRGPVPPTPGGPPTPPGARGRILRIRVTEDGEQKVNVAIPLAIARIGKMKIASSGLVRGVVNAFIRPIIELTSMPITCLTLGLFHFVIGELMLLLVSAIPGLGFQVNGIIAAFLGAIIIAIVGLVLSWILPD